MPACVTSVIFIIDGDESLVDFLLIAPIAPSHVDCNVDAELMCYAIDFIRKVLMHNIAPYGLEQLNTTKGSCPVVGIEPMKQFMGLGRAFLPVGLEIVAEAIEE